MYKLTTARKIVRLQVQNGISITLTAALSMPCRIDKIEQIPAKF